MFGEDCSTQRASKGQLSDCEMKRPRDIEKVSQAGPFGVEIVPIHLRMGIRHGVPACCIAHFCWDNMLGRAAGMTRWKQISHDRVHSRFVPCGIIHAGGSSFRLPGRLWRMLAFEWAFLQPPRLGRRRRAFASRGGNAYRESSVEERQRASDLGRLEDFWWHGFDRFEP